MARAGSAMARLGVLLLSVAAVGPLSAQGGETDSLPTTERVVCRSSVATGSMLNRHNVCLSERAWQLAPSDRRDEHDFTQEAALTLRSPDPAVAVQTGTADWTSFPALRMRGRLPYNQLVATTSELIRPCE